MQSIRLGLKGLHGVLWDVPEITNDQNMCLFKAIATEGAQIHYGVFIGIRQSLEGKGEREGERGRSRGRS